MENHHYIGMSQEKKRIQIRKTIVILSAALVLTALMTSLFATPCFALEELTTKVTGQFDSIYTSLGTVLTAAAAVAIGICAFKWIFGTDPAAVRQAKTWMLYIVIGIAVYWLAGTIVSTVKSMVS